MALVGEGIKMNVEIKIDRKDVDKAILRMPMRCRKAMADGLDHASRSFMNDLWQKRMQGPPGIKANPQGIFHRFRRVTMVDGKAVFLRVRDPQSETVSAIAHSSKSVFDMAVNIYSKSKVAGKLERGGTIQSSRPMPIPLNAEAREMMLKVGPKTNLKAVFPDLNPVVINGKFFLARKKMFGKKLQLLFILKRSVKVKAHLGFEETWIQHAPRREQILDEAFAKAMADL